MKLATYLAPHGPAIGIVTDDGLVPADRLAGSMIEAIGRWDELAPMFERLQAAGTGALALPDLHLLAPVPRPGKVLAIGLNYKDHIAETGLATPEHQLWFGKQATSVNGPFAPIEIPRAAPDTVDYEAELVAVIGRRGRHISRDAAPTHVFGYCCGNDVSVREWQRHTPQWMLGKSFDTHAPFGPWITTADALPDPHALDIRCLVNGEERQNSNTRHLLFDLWDQIAHLSRAMTLEPGDVIFTGTPGGVGAAHKPPRFLKAGDVVRVEIDQLGWIEATMAKES